MGERDWSAEQMERDLVERFSLLWGAERAGGMPPGESAALAEGVVRCMNGALFKVAESLEAQASLRQELARLREDLRAAETQRARSELRQRQRVAALELEVERLREQKRSLEDSLLRAERAGRHVEPPHSLLSHPLAVRSSQGEYLGVSDKSGQHFRIRDLMRLIGRSSSATRLVSTLWDRHGDVWALTVAIGGEDASPGRCFVLDVRQVRTPSGNRVCELERICVDGESVPDSYLLHMFRTLREGFVAGT